ncbi:MAG: hypothetical protein QUS12_01315, partial [Methanosarcina sp.]|nr:hypothetical protein [Methanosarcina sp.]
MIALKKAQEKPLFWKKPLEILYPVIFSVIAGIVFFLGLLNMPTMLLFALIIAIFTLSCFIMDFQKGVPSDYILLANCISFSVVLLLSPILWGNMHGSALSQYSFEHFGCYLLLIGGTFILWFLSRSVRKMSHFISIISLITLALILLLFFIHSTIINVLFSLFFAFPTGIETISEMKGVDLAYLLSSYNYGLVLFIAGFVILVQEVWKNRESARILLLVWSITMAVIFLQHRRFQYYFTVDFSI